MSFRLSPTIVSMVQFFVPDVAGLHPDPEVRYAELAALVGAQPVRPGERIASIEFTYDLDDWVARVGSVVHAKPSSGELEFDGATVLAIFPITDLHAAAPDATEMVVTDGRPIGINPSEWSNPFVPSRTTRRVLFDSPS